MGCCLSGTERVFIIMTGAMVFCLVVIKMYETWKGK